MVNGLVKKGLGALVDKKLDVSQQCALPAWKVNFILGYIKRGMAKQGEGYYCPPLSCLCETSSGALHLGRRPPVQERNATV